MVRWSKLPGDQYLGFWVLGLILFACLSRHHGEEGINGVAEFYQAL